MATKKKPVGNRTNRRGRGPKKGEGGRDKIKVDWKMVDDMCAIHCTSVEIVAVTGISKDTYYRRCKELYSMTFAQYIAEKSQNGKCSLRRLMWKKANSGSVAMLIFIAKNWLGMQDRPEQDAEDIPGDTYILNLTGPAPDGVDSEDA